PPLALRSASRLANRWAAAFAAVGGQLPAGMKSTSRRYRTRHMRQAERLAKSSTILCPEPSSGNPPQPFADHTIFYGRRNRKLIRIANRKSASPNRQAKKWHSPGRS